MKDIVLQDIDISKLDMLGLYELRNLGRVIGVPRPTTYSRDELIVAIKNQFKTGNIPVSQTSKKGRRPNNHGFDLTKLVASEPSYLLSVLEDDEELYKVRSGEIGTETRTISGFVHLLPKGGALIVGTDLNAYSLPVRLLSTYPLAMGDYLECTAIFSEARQVFVVDKIFEINGIKSEKIAESKKVRDANFDTIEGIRPNIERQMADIKYKAGGRILVFAPSTFDRVQDIANYTVACDKGIHIIALLTDETEDSVNYLREVGLSDIYLAKVNYNLKKQTLASLLCMFRAKQNVEQGKDVVLFIDSLTKLFKIFNNSAYPDGRVIPGEVVLAPLTDLKAFFMSARAIKDGGSLTIVAYFNNPENVVEEYIVNEFTDLANVIVKK